MSDLAIFSSIEKLINQKANLMKRASLHKNAFDPDTDLPTSTPDDPTGDGTVEPTTGEEYDRLEDDLENPVVEINATDDSQANTDSPDANLGNIGTDIYESDEPLVDEYNMDVPDPGTESQMKTSAYKFASMTLSQHNAIFKKLASLLMQDIRERSATTVKSASYTTARTPVINNQNDLYTRAQKHDLITKTAEADALRYCTNYAHQLRKMAEGEEISEEDIPVETLSDTLGDADAVPEITPEEASVLSELPPEVLEALVETPEPQLEQIEELAQAVQNGQIEPDSAVEVIAGNDGSCEGGSCEGGECEGESCDDKSSDSSEETKEARWKRAYLMRKIAEENPVTEADIAAASELPPEDMEAIENLPPEALDEIIELANAVESGEIPPEVAVQALEGDPASDVAGEAMDTGSLEPTEEEAAEEMSNVLEDEGVTPTDLETVAETSPEVKAAKLRKIAACCRKARSRGKKPRKKSARATIIRNHCKRALYEILN